MGGADRSDVYEYSQREHEVWHLATVSKKGAAQRSADLSDACRPITKQTQSARQPTIRTTQNATQCNTMLLVTTNAVGSSNRRSIPRLSQERAQPNRQRTSRTPAAPLRSKPNLPGNQRFARFKMQHNATQYLVASPMQSDGTRSCRIPRLSQKRAQPNGQWTSRTPAAPLRSKPNPPGLPTIRTIQNATQCNTMFTRLTNAVRRNTKLSHPATVPKK